MYSIGYPVNLTSFPLPDHAPLLMATFTSDQPTLPPWELSAET